MLIIIVILCFQFNVQARDQSYPEKFSSTTVQINVDRDQFTPHFDLQTYSVTILETLLANSTQPLVTVLAVDRDVKVIRGQLCLLSIAGRTTRL